jgi:hypothetical protein
MENSGKVSVNTIELRLILKWMDDRVSFYKRLEEYYCRLDEAPEAQSAEEALQLVCDTLDRVEDEH